MDRSSSVGTSVGPLVWAAIALCLLPGCEETQTSAVPEQAAIDGWNPPGTLVASAPVRPPGSKQAAVLALVPERAQEGQPLQTAVWLIPSGTPGQARVLSPEPGYNFWAARSGDVDDDGAEEMGLCSWICTARDPEYKRRFFVYGWDESGDLKPT